MKLLPLVDHLLDKVLAAALPIGPLIEIRLLNRLPLLCRLIDLLVNYRYQLLLAYLLYYVSE